MTTSDETKLQENERVTIPEEKDTRIADPELNKREKDLGFFERNPRAKFAIFAILLLAVFAGVLFWLHSRQWVDTDDAQVDGHIYNVNARVGGQVIQVLADDGQFVHAGDVLVQIDPKDYQVALQKAQADYDDAVSTSRAAVLNVPITTVGSTTQISSAGADVINAKAGFAAAQRQADAANAQLVEAQANARKLNADVERYRQLLGKREIAQQQFDQAVTSAEAANATVAAREASLRAANEQVRQASTRIAQAQANLTNAQITPKQIAVTKARAESAQAQMEQKQAALEQAKLNLQYATIVAPVDGIVGRRAVQIGQNVQPGTDLFAIVPLRDVWVTANFKETQLEHMRPGQEVEVKVDTYGERKWKARVSAIGGATGSRYSLLPPENATGNYVKVVQRIPVRIEFDGKDKQDFNQDGRLRPGMSVTPDVKVR
jgi:membrane fusion protein (multidrug efflux system)